MQIFFHEDFFHCCNGFNSKSKQRIKPKNALWSRTMSICQSSLSVCLQNRGFSLKLLIVWGKYGKKIDFSITIWKNYFKEKFKAAADGFAMLTMMVERTIAVFSHLQYLLAMVFRSYHWAQFFFVLQTSFALPKHYRIFPLCSHAKWNSNFCNNK